MAVQQPAGVRAAGVRPAVHRVWGVRAGAEEPVRVLPVRGPQRGGVQEEQDRPRV